MMPTPEDLFETERQFIEIEIELANTFADNVSIHSRLEDSQRSLQNARKGYETALYFLTKYPTISQDGQLASALQRLGKRLKTLGEDVPLLSRPPE